jgi:hypothetical protein
MSNMNILNNYNNNSSTIVTNNLTLNQDNVL